MAGEVNWLGVVVPTVEWAAKLFPVLPAEEAVDRLWQIIFGIVRLNEPDPRAAWQLHLAELAARRSILTDKGFEALRFRGPGTDLTIGLAPRHLWAGGSVVGTHGIEFTPNIPTEEVFSLPHRDRAEGVVSATKPLNLRGVVVEDFNLTFEGGRVTSITAARGEEMLRRMIDADEGAGRLGEVALVPHSSPVSQSNMLFYDTLYDENAASHLALGDAYKLCMHDGPGMADAAFLAAGGNRSLIHVDFMIGSDKVDVDGLTADGRVEQVMRAGEWAFPLS
jgi:aminopeptidase